VVGRHGERAERQNATEEQWLKAMQRWRLQRVLFARGGATQAEPTDDLMSVLVHAEVDGDRLSPDDFCTNRC